MRRDISSISTTAPLWPNTCWRQTKRKTTLDLRNLFLAQYEDSHGSSHRSFSSLKLPSPRVFQQSYLHPHYKHYTPTSTFTAPKNSGQSARYHPGSAPSQHKSHHKLPHHPQH